MVGTNTRSATPSKEPVMSQGDTAGLLQYARYYGIACDHTLDFENEVHFNIPSTSALLAGLADAPEPDLPRAISCCEKLNISKNAVSFLQNVFDLQKPLTEDFWSKIDLCRPKASRLELPLLRTDHDADVHHFEYQKGCEVVEAVQCPTIINAEQDGASLESESFHDVRMGYDRLSRTEKLEVSPTDMLFLKDSITSDFSRTDLEQTFSEDIICPTVCVHFPDTGQLLIRGSIPFSRSPSPHRFFHNAPKTLEFSRQTHQLTISKLCSTTKAAVMSFDYWRLRFSKQMLPSKKMSI